MKVQIVTATLILAMGLMVSPAGAQNAGTQDSGQAAPERPEPPRPAVEYVPADPAYNDWYKVVSDSDDAAADAFNKAGDEFDAKDTVAMCATLHGIQDTIATEIDALNHMTALLNADSHATPDQRTYEEYVIGATMDSVSGARVIADNAVADNCKAS